MTSRKRRWLWWTGGVAVVLAVAALLIVAAVPWAVRWAATAWAESIIGRPVTTGDIDVALRDARVVFRDVMVAGTGDDRPLAIERVVLDLRWRPMLSGRVRIERLELWTPVVRIARTPDGTTTIDDVMAHLQRDRTTTAPPRDIVIEQGVVEDGRIVFTDLEVTPTRTWEMRDITATAADLATRGEARGSGSLTARLADGDLHIDADAIRLWPFHLGGKARATGLDIAGAAAYVPDDAPLRPVAGRLSAHTSATVGSGGVALEGRATLVNLEALRPGQRETFVTAPRITMATDGVRMGSPGPTTAERVEIEGTARVHDTRAAGTGPVELSRIHGILRDVSLGGGAPASVKLEVALPDNGTLEARGTATFEPTSAALVVSVSDAPLALLAAYIPPTSPVQLRDGRVGAELNVRLTADQAVQVSGDVHASGFGDPFLVHPRLDIAIHDLRVHGGALTLERLTVSGHPTFVDRSVTPAVRWEVAEATGTITNLSWPSGPPARVQATARLATGGRSTLEGTIRPSPLEVTARVRVHDLAAARLNAYLPDTAAVRVADGTVAADVRVQHAEGGPVQLAGTVTAATVALHTAAGTPIVTDPSLRLAASAAVQPGGIVVIERATLDATPQVAGVTLRALHVEVEQLRWPATGGAPLRATARLPQSGSIEASGTLAPKTGDVALTVAVRDAALGPWAPLLDVDAPLAGRLDAALTVAGNYRSPERLKTSGEATAREIRIGATEDPEIRVQRLTARGLQLVGRERLHVDALVGETPAVVVTRTKDGGFPILAMLGLQRDEPPDVGGPATADRAVTDDRGRMAIDVDRIAIDNGYGRFVDRATSPPFTQELRSVSAMVRDLDNTDAQPARVELDAVVGEGGALDLAGTIAPFAEPFVLDVAGTLSDFAVPGTNPYLRQVFGWVAGRGRLTTQVHYRVEGDRLQATNDILVENLSVRRATGEVDPRVGLPLGLIVALLKNARGDIEVSVPVSGDLGSPEFGFGDALARAGRQLIGTLVTGPFRAIARALRDDEPAEVADLEVDPVRFPEGSARLAPEAHEHLEQVADFLREAPHVGITLRPVVTRDDLSALRHEAAVARVQRYERTHQVADFDAAARALAGAGPEDPIDTVLETLAAREPLPIDEAQQLAARRAAAAREALAATAPETLPQVQRGAAAIERNDAEGGRVEIDLAPRGTAEGS